MGGFFIKKALARSFKICGSKSPRARAHTHTHTYTLFVLNRFFAKAKVFCTHFYRTIIKCGYREVERCRHKSYYPDHSTLIYRTAINSVYSETGQVRHFPIYSNAVDRTLNDLPKFIFATYFNRYINLPRLCCSLRFYRNSRCSRRLENRRFERSPTGNCYRLKR